MSCYPEIGPGNRRGTRSRAEGDNRSEANKGRQHERRSSRRRARGNAGGCVGVVGPKRARGKQGDPLGRTTLAASPYRLGRGDQIPAIVGMTSNKHKAPISSLSRIGVLSIGTIIPTRMKHTSARPSASFWNRVLACDLSLLVDIRSHPPPREEGCIRFRGFSPTRAKSDGGRFEESTLPPIRNPRFRRLGAGTPRQEGSNPRRLGPSVRRTPVTIRSSGQ